MSRQRFLFVNLFLAAGACSVPEPPHVTREAPETTRVSPYTASPALAPPSRFDTPVESSWAPLPAHLTAPRRRAWPGAGSNVSGILPDVRGARFDQSRGSALEQRLGSLPPERSAFGIGGIEPLELFGAPQAEGLCEAPHILFEVDHEGETWQGSLRITEMLLIEEGFTPQTYALPGRCVEALAAAGGLDGVGSGCRRSDEQAHYPEGSDCQICLADDGDHGRCLAEAACPAQAQRKASGGGRWYDAMAVSMLMCAPDIVQDAVVLVAEGTDVDDLPGPFEYQGFEALCIPVWLGGESDLVCSFADIGHSIADVVLTNVGALTPPAGGDLYVDRVSLLSELEVDGRVFAGTWMYENTIGNLAMPKTAGATAWGLIPQTLRPDGSALSNIDDTYARDWIAGIALKTFTTRPGVPIWPYNHNRCLDWAPGLVSDVSVCTEVGPWDEETGWLDDGPISWFDPQAEQMLYLPFTTLASTGLPDTSVPGAILPVVMGSTSLAALDDCSFGETFEPDLMHLFDTNPALDRDPYGSFDGETWRFGQPGRPDVRLAVATAQQRGFCFDE